MKSSGMTLKEMVIFVKCIAESCIQFLYVLSCVGNQQNFVDADST